MFKVIILTLFPDMFPGPLGQSLAGQALAKRLWSLETIDIRDFSEDRHRTVDASPYGGGTGMVLKPDVLGRAVEHAKARLPNAPILYFTPRGMPMTQGLAQDLKTQDVILLCGRFEGVDQRVIDHYQMLEVSLGDFILSGGEIPAMALLDAVVRLLPGVIGKAAALAEESFIPPPFRPPPQAGGIEVGKEFAGLLEYPHYTRPPSWEGQPVPEVLLSGNHEEIRRWRRLAAEDITRERRPDMWERYKQK